MSYGADTVDIFKRSASYIDRILKGASPADLPAQAPVKFEIAINLKTARALGLDIPPNLLALADEVIRIIRSRHSDHFWYCPSSTKSAAHSLLAIDAPDPQHSLPTLIYCAVRRCARR